MLTNHANAYLYCKSIQNKSNTATIYQKITYIPTIYYQYV